MIFDIIARDGASGSFRAIGKEAEAAGLSVGKLTAGVAGAAAVFAAFAVNAAAKFQQSMTRISTQAGVPIGQIKDLSNAVLDLAPKVGTGPDALALSLYHVESAFRTTGIAAKDALAIVKNAAELAKIGGANLEDTTQAIVGTLASGIKGVKDAADAAAQLNQLVGSGDTTLEAVTKAIGTGVLPVAQTLGLSFNDVAAALATLSDNATPIDEAATRFRTTLSIIANGSPKAKKALESIGIAGSTLANDFRKPDGLLVAFEDLKKHLDASGKNATQQAQLILTAFGGAKSGATFLTLFDELDRLRSKYKDNGTAAQAAAKFQEAWNNQQATFKQKLDDLIASWDVFLVRIGQGLIPGLSKILDDFTKLPNLFRPITNGLGDVWGALKNLQAALLPIEKAVAVAFGAAVLATIDAFGASLRDVVAPAIKGVADGLDFLEKHKAIVAGLATVIGVALLPKLVAMGIAIAGDVAASAAFVAVNLAGSIEAAGKALIGFVATNPELAIMAVVAGGVAAAFAVGAHNARSFTIDVQGLTDAVKALQANGSQKPLAETILGDISKWKVTLSGLPDGITFLRKYGVAAGDLAKQLADPQNLAGVESFTKALQHQLAYSPGLTAAKRLAADLTSLRPYLASTNPAVATLGKLFTGLLNDKSVNLTTINTLAKDFQKLATATSNTLTQQGAYAQAQKDLQAALKPTNDALSDQGTSYISVADGQKEVAASSKALKDLNGQLKPELDGINKVLDAQIDFFKGVQTQSDLTAQTLLKNAQDTVNAYRDETANIKKLQSEGASADLIKGLFQAGPQALGLAANAGPDFVKQYQTLLTQAEQSKATTASTAFAAIDPVGALEKQLANRSHDAAIQDAYRALLIRNFQPIATQLLGLAKFTGKGIPENVAQAILQGKFRVVGALAEGFTGPQKNAVNILETLATTGGAQMQKNLADAIENHTPLVVSKAEALKLGINDQIRAILSAWGITVNVDDQATASLKQIRDYANQLIDLGLGTPALISTAAQGGSHGFGAGRSAAGGHITGPGTGTSDSIPRWLSNGEYVVRAASVKQYGVGFFDALNAGMAAGGIVARSGIVINEDAATSGLLGLFQGAAAGASVGGGAQQWAPLVLQVLAMIGQSASWLPNVLRQINTESGGNPSAINLWDSNAQIGQPSQGLLQTIPSTFAAYAGPYASLGITNPLANIYAALNYAVSRYGSLGILGQGHGYANGTSSALRGWAKVGERGPEWVNFGGGEQVLKHGQSPGIGTVLHIENYHAADTVSEDGLAQRLAMKTRAVMTSRRL